MFRKKKLIDKKIVIISRDCIGGILYHQLGMKFYSPTINLFFSMSDFNFFCNNLKEYINAELVEIKNASYPQGLLSPREKLPTITVHFLHYSSFDKAKKKWRERSSRIDFMNDMIFVVNNCTNNKNIAEVNKRVIEGFNLIQYKKVIFTQYEMGFDNEYVIPPMNNKYHNAYLIDKKLFSHKRTFNVFNFNKFFYEK